MSEAVAKRSAKVRVTAKDPAEKLAQPAPTSAASA